MTITLNPLGNRLLIRKEIITCGEEGKIIIPGEERPKLPTGVVDAIGPKVSEDIAVGDVVLYGSHLRSGIPIDGEEYFVLSEPEIIAIVLEKS